MYVHIVKISNFKNLKNVELHFNKFNLITGVYGQGKSAIFEALVYSLTGHLDGKIKDYVRWGQESFNIEINFNHDGKDYDYLIQGNIKSSSKKELTRHDNQDVIHNNEATQFIRTLIDPNLTLFSNVSLQGKTTDLLFVPPSKRLENLKKLFGITRLDIASTLIKDDIFSLKDKQKTSEILLENLKGKTFNYFELKDIEDKSFLEDEIEKLKLKKDKWVLENKVWNDYIDKLNEYQTSRSKLRSLIVEREDLEDDLKDIGEEICIDFPYKDFEDTKEKYQNHLEIKEQFERDVKSNAEIKERISIQERSIKSNIKKIEEFQTKINSIKKLSFDYSDLEKLRQEVRDLEFKIQDLENKIKLIEKGQCPTCGNDFKDDNVDDYIKELTSKKEHFELKNKSLSEWESELYENKKNVEINKTLQDRVDDLKQDVETAKELNEIEVKKIKDLDDVDITTLEDFISDYRIEVERLEKQRDEYNKIDKENDEKREKRKEIENKIISLDTKIEMLQEYKKPEEVEKPEEFNNEYYDKCKNEFLEYQQNVKENERLEERNKEIKKEEENNENLIKKEEENLFNIKRSIQLLNGSRKILDKDFSAYLISDGTEFIKKKMNEFFSSIDERYYIDYEHDGKGVSFKYTEDFKHFSEINMASGFEKDLISIANRVALISMNTANFIMLDEVDKYSSVVDAVRLFEILIEQKFEQYFIISHSDYVKEYIKNLPQTNIFEINKGNFIEENY